MGLFVANMWLLQIVLFKFSSSGVLNLTLYVICRSALRHMKEDQLKKFEYCLPCEFYSSTTNTS